MNIELDDYRLIFAKAAMGVSVREIQGIRDQSTSSASSTLGRMVKRGFLVGRVVRETAHNQKRYYQADGGIDKLEDWLEVQEKKKASSEAKEMAAIEAAERAPATTAKTGWTLKDEVEKKAKPLREEISPGRTIINGVSNLRVRSSKPPSPKAYPSGSTLSTAF